MTLDDPDEAEANEINAICAELCDVLNRHPYVDEILVGTVDFPRSADRDQYTPGCQGWA
jgi:hypothetical protein